MRVIGNPRRRKDGRQKQKLWKRLCRLQKKEHTRDKYLKVRIFAGCEKKEHTRDEYLKVFWGELRHFLGIFLGIFIADMEAVLKKMKALRVEKDNVLSQVNSRYY